MPCSNIDYPTSRRHFLRSAGCGFGAVALAALLRQPVFGADGTLPSSAKKLPRGFGKAKNVIFLFMEGGPSHLDTFDYKPLLNQLAGQKLPPSLIRYSVPSGPGNNMGKADFGSPTGCRTSPRTRTIWR